MVKNLERSDQEWRKILTDEQFEVLRGRGTERPFSGKFNECKIAGIYCCSGCGNPLFLSINKYDSGTGWPSFWAPISSRAVQYEEDQSFSMVRTEVSCAACGGHLGHVFPDGPEPSGKRYCINSISLSLEPE